MQPRSKTNAFIKRTIIGWRRLALVNAQQKRKNLRNNGIPPVKAAVFHVPVRYRRFGFQAA